MYGVGGTIDKMTPGWCVIYEFWSHEPGEGNAKATLNKLRDEFGKISVVDVGEEGDSSYSFWIHMLNSGVVDEVHDTWGEVLLPRDSGLNQEKR